MSISVSLKSFRRMKHRLSDYVNKLLDSAVLFLALLLTGALHLLLCRQVRFDIHEVHAPCVKSIGFTGKGRSKHVVNFEVLKNKVRIRFDDAACDLEDQISRFIYARLLARSVITRAKFTSFHHQTCNPA
jgi:hypothetical protein